MKKSNIIALLCIAALASCQKENVLQENQGKQFTITVGTEDTKVAIDGLNVVFNAGDEIVVYVASPTKHNKFTTTEGGANASFTGTLASEASSYTIAYPYGISGTDYTFGGSTFQYTIPDVQVATKNSVDPKAHFLIANNVTDLSQPITLKNLVSLMKVEVPDGLKVREIQVGGAKACNTAICGKTQYWYTNGNFTMPDVNQTSSVITVVPQEGNEFIEEGTYYIAVMPRTVNGGITIAYVNENYQLCKRQSANSVTFTAGHVKRFGTLGAGYTAVTGNTVLRYYGAEQQLTGRLKKIAGGTGSETADDNTIEKIVFKAHSLYSSAYVIENNKVSAGSSSVHAYAVLKGSTMYVYTEAPCFTLNSTNSTNLFRNFAALKEVTFNNINAQENTSCSYMFRNDPALETVDFGVCDLSNVKDMSYMFYTPNPATGSPSSLQTVRLGKTATTSATTFQSMFNSAKYMTEIDLGPNFAINGGATVTNMFADTGLETSKAGKKCTFKASASLCENIGTLGTSINTNRFIFVKY